MAKISLKKSDAKAIGTKKSNDEVEEYPPYVRNYETLKEGLFRYLNRYDSSEYLALIFSALAVDSFEYKSLWDEFERTYKSKVKKGEPWNLAFNFSARGTLGIDEPQRFFVYAIEPIDSEFARQELLGEFEMTPREFMKEFVIDDLMRQAERFSKSTDSMTTKDMIKTLKSKGYIVFKAEDEVSDETTEEDMEESSEVEEVGETTEDTEDDSDVEVEIDVDKKSRKSKRKSGADILKSKGWVRKTDDKGPDSEDVEDGAIDEKAVTVPDTKEPSDNVEDADTGVPEDDELHEDSKSSQKVGDKEGNDIDELKEGPQNSEDIANMDIGDLIESKKMKKEEQKPPASFQPFSNNYRTTQMGEGKMSISNAITPKGSVGKGRK
jgi:hypothetical protein